MTVPDALRFYAGGMDKVSPFPLSNALKLSIATSSQKKASKK